MAANCQPPIKTCNHLPAMPPGHCTAQGCQSRFHMPPEKDPDYKAVVDQKDEFFINEFTKLGQEGEEVQKANWALEAKKIKIQQLDDIKDHVEEERVVVRRFKDPLDLDEKVGVGDWGKVGKRAPAHVRLLQYVYACANLCARSMWRYGRIHSANHSFSNSRSW